VSADPGELAAYRDRRIKASEEEIAAHLQGNWQEDLLYLAQMDDRSQGADLPKEKRKTRLRKKKGNTPGFDLRQELFRITGKDLTQIDGVDVMTATTILSEVGWT